MGANKYRGEVTIEIGGEERIVRFSWDAMARAKAEVGDRLFDAVVDMDLDVLARLLTVGLQEHWPEATAETIKGLSPPILPVQTALIEALNLAFYGRREGATAEPEPDPLDETTGSPETGSPNGEPPPSSAVSNPMNSGG